MMFSTLFIIFADYYITKTIQGRYITTQKAYKKMKKKPYKPPTTQLEPLEGMHVLAGTDLELYFDSLDYTDEALSNQSTGEWDAKKGLWDENEE